jgi:hypothetical protein
VRTFMMFFSYNLRQMPKHWLWTLSRIQVHSSLPFCCPIWWLILCLHLISIQLPNLDGSCLLYTIAVSNIRNKGLWETRPFILFLYFVLSWRKTILQKFSVDVSLCLLIEQSPLFTLKTAIDKVWWEGHKWLQLWSIFLDWTHY